MGFDELDNNIEIMLAKMDLEGETCHLKHSKADPAENHPAINYLCQNLGNQTTNEIKHQLRIPICEECVEALYDTNWILFYCTYCHHSQWLYRPLAKDTYPSGNGIYWLDVCPFCAEIKDEYGKEA